MARPVVALLTDFGTRDHYAGTLKGVRGWFCAVTGKAQPATAPAVAMAVP